MSEYHFVELEPERLARLNDEQRAIVLARVERKIIFWDLLKKIKESTDLDQNQHLFDIVRDYDGPDCEHGNDILDYCADCQQIEDLLFPENKDSE